MVSLDSVALAEGRVEDLDPGDPRATQVVSCGRPQRGCEVQALAESLSTIRLSSPSLARGYHLDGEQTAERFQRGWLETNDLGFMRDGQLYVVGRSDDVLTVAGRNVYATEIESAVGALEVVRTGCSTIVEVPGARGARLVMLMELNGNGTAHKTVAQHAARIGMQKAGITIDEFVFLERGAIPKTPSGKVQRFRARQLFATGGLEPVARVALRRS